MTSKWIVPIGIYFSSGVEPDKFMDVLLDSEESTTVTLRGSSHGGVIFANWKERGKTALSGIPERLFSALFSIFSRLTCGSSFSGIPY